MEQRIKQIFKYIDESIKKANIKSLKYKKQNDLGMALKEFGKLEAFLEIEQKLKEIFED